MPGLDEELEAEEVKLDESNVVDMPKRRPYHFWEVGGTQHKMKLTTSMITQLEAKYKANIGSIVVGGDIPPLSVMLTIAQAAIAPWEHGTKYDAVEKMYDQYINDGGNMTDFYTKVILPTLAVSGFFPQAAVENLMSELNRETLD